MSCSLEDFSRELLGDLSRGGGGEDQSLLCELLMGSDTREQCTVGQSPKGMVVFLELAIVRVAGC